MEIYLRDDQHYDSRYDVQTIRECLSLYWMMRESIDKKVGSEKASEPSKEEKEEGWMKESLPAWEEKLMFLFSWGVKPSEHKNQYHNPRHHLWSRKPHRQRWRLGPSSGPLNQPFSLLEILGGGPGRNPGKAI